MWQKIWEYPIKVFTLHLSEDYTKFWDALTFYFLIAVIELNVLMPTSPKKESKSILMETCLYSLRFDACFLFFASAFIIEDEKPVRLLNKADIK